MADIMCCVVIKKELGTDEFEMCPNIASILYGLEGEEPLPFCSDHAVKLDGGRQVMIASNSQFFILEIKQDDDHASPDQSDASSASISDGRERQGTDDRPIKDGSEENEGTC